MEFQKNLPATGWRASEVHHGVCGSGAILTFMSLLNSDGKQSQTELPSMTLAMGGQARGGAYR